MERGNHSAPPPLYSYIPDLVGDSSCLSSFSSRVSSDCDLLGFYQMYSSYCSACRWKRETWNTLQVSHNSTDGGLLGLVMIPLQTFIVCRTHAACVLRPMHPTCAFSVHRTYPLYVCSTQHACDPLREKSAKREIIIFKYAHI